MSHVAYPKPPKRTRSRIAYDRVRKDVAGRSGERCEIGSSVCELRGTECHHLLPRAQGGRDEIGNCVWTCAPCHVYVHAHPAESYERGWLRHREAS